MKQVAAVLLSLSFGQATVAATTLLASHRGSSDKQQRSSVLPQQKVPADAIVDASVNYFMVQKVGLQKNGMEMPRSPFSEQAKSCLTQGPSDIIGGLSLYWHECQNSQLLPKFDRKLEDMQMFSFTFSGQIRQKISGLCVRRAACQSRTTYDLGSCDDETTASFRVTKAVANSLEHLYPLGTPAQAIADEHCDICGPYMILSHKAQKNYEAQPGWTKGRSQFVGQAAAMGYQPPKSPDSIAVWLKDSLNDGRRIVYNDPFIGDTSGLGHTEKEGICGSHVTDGPAKDSMFFLLRAMPPSMPPTPIIPPTPEP